MSLDDSLPTPPAAPVGPTAASPAAPVGPTAASPALPVVVIGGYLGAGKTTLINHLLRHAGGLRVAVLVNDFGSVNIDAELLAGAASPEAGVLALTGGCLCCSFGDDLVGTLTALRQRSPAPEVVLIELSGVALPAAVVRTARLALGVQVVGTLVLADAEQIERQAADRYVGDTVLQQLRDADWLLLNKTDLVPDGDAAHTLRWLAQAAPQARQMACAAAALPAELVLGWRGEPADAVGAASSVHTGRAGSAAEAASFSPRPLRAHHPDTTAQPFASATFSLPPGTQLDALGAALADAGSGVLRAKGLLAQGPGQAQLLQVAGRRWAVEALPLAQQVTPGGQLVVIGLRGQMDEAALQAMIGGCSHLPAPAAGGTPWTTPSPLP